MFVTEWFEADFKEKKNQRNQCQTTQQQTWSEILLG